MASMQVDASNVVLLSASRFEHIVRTLEEEKESLDESKIRQLHLLSNRVARPDTIQRIDKLQRIRKPPVVAQSDNIIAKDKKTISSSVPEIVVEESRNDESTAQDMRILLQDQKVSSCEGVCVVSNQVSFIRTWPEEILKRLSLTEPCCWREWQR